MRFTTSLMVLKHDKQHIPTYTQFGHPATHHSPKQLGLIGPLAIQDVTISQPKGLTWGGGAANLGTSLFWVRPFLTNLRFIMYTGWAQMQSAGDKAPSNGPTLCRATLLDASSQRHHLPTIKVHTTKCVL